MMMLGVVYHAAFPFAPNRPWLTRFPEQQPWFNALILVVHSFRMQAFFLISGFLASMVLERYGAARFLRKRVQRLVPPWVGAMVLVCAPAVWILTGSVAPKVLAGTHLWFLPVLFSYALLQSAAFRIVAPARLQGLADRGAPWVNLPVAILAVAAAAGVQLVWLRVAWRLPLNELSSLTLSFVDVDQMGEYVVYYLAGAALWFFRRHLDTLLRAWPLYLVASVGYFAALIQLGPDAGGYAVEALRHFTAFAMALLTFAAWKAAGAERFYRPWLANFSYTLYLFHMPITWLLLSPLKRLTADPVTAFLVLSALTIAICAAIHAVVMRSRALSFLFNGELQPVR